MDNFIINEENHGVFTITLYWADNKCVKQFNVPTA